MPFYCGIVQLRGSLLEKVLRGDLLYRYDRTFGFFFLLFCLLCREHLLLDRLWFLLVGCDKLLFDYLDCERFLLNFGLLAGVLFLLS